MGLMAVVIIFKSASFEPPPKPSMHDESTPTLFLGKWILLKQHRVSQHMKQCLPNTIHHLRVSTCLPVALFGREVVGPAPAWGLETRKQKEG